LLSPSAITARPGQQRPQFQSGDLRLSLDIKLPF